MASMRPIRLLLILSLVCSVFAEKPTKVEQPTILTTIQKVKGFTYPIVCYKKNEKGEGEMVSILGTGFFLANDRRIITAGHVANDLYPQDATKCPIRAIYVPVNGWTLPDSEATFSVRYVNINTCRRGTNLDIAACSFAGDFMKDDLIKVKPTSGVLYTPLLSDGTAVAFTGFPLLRTTPITSRGIVAAYSGYTNLGATELIIDKNAWPGASGSPVYDESGRVIGMIVLMGLNQGSGLAYALPASIIQKFLKDNLESFDGK